MDTSDAEEAAPPKKTTKRRTPARRSRAKKDEDEEEQQESSEEEEEEEEEDNDKSGNYRGEGEESSSEEESEEPQEKYQFISEQTSKHLEKIRKEQKSLLNRLKEKQKKELVGIEDPQEKVKVTFRHLLEQTEIYSSFTPNLSMHTIIDGTSSSKKGGSRRKHSEKEEDEEIIREALEDEEESYQGVLLTSSPKFIENTTLRSYQIDGVNWMIRLHDRGVNGILADEMGLGKTVQTLTWIAYLKFIRRIRGPHLVIVPKSVIPNWVNQANQWCPSLQVLKFHGDKDQRREIKEKSLVGGKFEIVVTSYETAIKEKAALNKFRWYSIIIDEAHRIKNENSILSQSVRVFDCQYRLLLTGTPLQNNLHELWSLLNFLLPDVFRSADDFDTWFNLKEGQAETHIIDQLHKVLKPFLLRRLKTEVKTDIPPKKEIYVECGLSKLQKEWYRSILTKDLNSIKGGEKVRLLNVVMQLRKCCNHPYLFDGAEPGPPYTLGDHLMNNSGKMYLVDKLLKKLKEQNSRVLIFTQMTRMLDILEDYCYLRNYEYCRIDGQTSSELREQHMDEFNKEGSSKFIFLLSTRAGGLGINLATADTVIIYDSDWNPQADLQAQDRCHRIGQKKPVNVYRLISKDSIEEKIYQRAVKKLYLDAVVIQQGRLAEQNNKLSKTELMSMIKFGAEEVFKSTESTITDEDLDAILSRGEQKIQEIDQQYKNICQNNLLNFSLTNENNLYEFEGLDYSKKATTMISLEKLVSKNYKAKFCKKNDKFILQLEEEALKEESQTVRSERLGRRNKQTEQQIAIEEAQQKRGPKEPKYYDFQFLNTKRLLELWEKETQFEQEKKKRKKNKDSDEKEDEEAGELTKEEKSEKRKLLLEGFNNWSKKDFQSFIKGCEKFGRKDYANIAVEVEKTEQQIKKYSNVFWKRYKEIKDYDKLIKRIERGESQLQKIDNNNLMLRYKTQKYINPWLEMKFNYGQNQVKEFTPEEDSFICCMTAKLGYGFWEEVRAQIRNAWEFRFDWFIKTRTAVEIQKRCDTLIKLIEKEYQDELKVQEKEKSKRKLEPSASGNSTKKVKK
ncbi:predicted protein [Naegleria gruberi]|uniref:Predicted protein n=1 Tax=Naegleria gruberi TaxID=5762 RepID=D2VVJ6_NAEGR|nr:uncharacterized protein NAEGRDRAFT_60899 [Naegleria gruberi]EFC39046.1 predicted protein [Naegleria gruberi]|eukprot:XP_002671790.1 predicted protein [Naegleria gruberi strain NEG-M]